MKKDQTLRLFAFLPAICLVGFLFPFHHCLAQAFRIDHDGLHKTVSFGNEKMTMTLDYNNKATISSLVLNNQQVIQGDAGIYSSIRTKETTYSSLKLLTAPRINITAQSVRLNGIQYGDKNFPVSESWIFTITKNQIKFDIERTVSKELLAEESGIPVFLFSKMDTWEGAYQDYGGLSWFYLFNKQLDTYGIHSSSSRFWNSKTGNGLAIEISATDQQVVMDYSRTADDQLRYRVFAAASEIPYRFDSVTRRRRFLRDTTAVWAPIILKAGKTGQSISLSYFDFKEQFGRGNLVGLNESQVSGVLNTIARIGVIDKQHFGGNSWHTPYGPICLHEQYIAQMGLAINDNTYLKGYQQCLDYYRDNAIKADGRVWPRWAYSNEDAMPQEFTDKGFYEAQWGYLLDSNPDYVTNVAELYDQTGDRNWVKSQQLSCEKALDWILNRDNNGNGLVEMITDSHLQKRGSDWIDIIWAAYENAFVNAKLYRALVLWAEIEKQLGNNEKEKQYKAFALKLKSIFNKPVTEGGFWDEEKKCYVHWRDKDGSIHGNNMVTPVNFMAIAYGICDAEDRSKTILDDIEVQMEKENLFFWPLCLYSYAPGEGNDWQFPFPNYENGDIFLSWGSVAVKAYASYKPELALKYVKNVLAQYAKDGLAFQRYGRAKQDGLGDDILAGNSLAVVGLYQSIYGINPLYNRFYLNPHLTKDLDGTQLKYNYRNQKLVIDLSINRYAVSDGRFRIISKKNFSFFSNEKVLWFFPGDRETPDLKLKAGSKNPLSLEIISWDQENKSWIQSSKNAGSMKLQYQVAGLTPGNYYSIFINKNLLKRTKSLPDGSLEFDYAGKQAEAEIRIINK